MAAVIRNTSQLTAEDRDAMAAYIKSLPPVEGPKKPREEVALGIACRRAGPGVR